MAVSTHFSTSSGAPTFTRTGTTSTSSMAGMAARIARYKVVCWSILPESSLPR